MSKKVLVADDGQSLKKIAEITLKQRGHQVFLAPNLKTLRELLARESFDLLCLDVQLSAEKDVYVLCKELALMYPQMPIILLYPALDDFNAQTYLDSKAKDKIFKPIDTLLFVETCEKYLKVSNNPEISKDFQLENWFIKTSTGNNSEDEPEPEESRPIPPATGLLNELQSWSIEVPPVLSGEKFSSLLKPDVILNEFQMESDEAVLPLESDLSYPDTEELSGTSVQKIREIKLSSRLVSLDELNLTPEDKVISPAQQPTKSIEIRPELEASIRDEFSREDFWAVDASADADEEETEDSVQQTPAPQSLENPLSVEELMKQAKEKLKAMGALGPQVVENSPPPSSFDHTSFESEMRQLVQDKITVYLAQEAKSIAEKVAWEIIPELAERIIREEISKISNKVQSQL